MNEKGFIYRIENLINNKEYVGCTIYPIKKRFEEHSWRCLNTDSNSKLCNSMRKYGIENFTINLIEECDIDKIYEREKFFINELKTFNLGLNSTIGGEGCLGYKHSKEVRDKISNIIKEGRSHKGKTYEEIYGDRMLEEKINRQESVKKSWENLTDEERELRINNIRESRQKKSKYGIDLVVEIKNKIKEGLTYKQFTELYPEVRKNFYYELKNGKRWVNV
jgi:group I intron endonuclease